jgi:malonate transporter and related proteins
MMIFLTSLPIFIIIFSGYLASKFHAFDPSAANLLARLIFYIIMPITLFFDLAQLPIDQLLICKYMLAYFFSSLSIIAATIIISKYLFKRNIPNIILNSMAATHSNTAYIAIPLFLTLFKTIIPVASIIIVQTVFNFLIIFGLDISTNSQTKHGNHYKALLIIFENPILIGTLLGLCFSYFQIELPTVVHSTFSMVSQSAAFVALFALGLSLGNAKFEFAKKQKLEILVLIILKTIMHPIAAFMIGYYLLGLSGFLLTALTLMAAMPTAKNLFVFAERYQIGLERANIIILITTVLSIATINTILLARHVF